MELVVYAGSSEFEELEAVPSMSVIEGPLEPPATASPATDAPEVASFVNFFSAAMNLGTNAPNSTNSIQPYHSISTTPLSSDAPPAVSAPAPTPSVSSLPLSAPPSHDSVSSSNRVTNLVKPFSFFAPHTSSSSSLMMPPISSLPPIASALHPPLNLPLSAPPSSDSVSSSNRVTNLIKPSSFFAPPTSSSSSLMMPIISSSPLIASALHPPLNLQRPYGTPLLQPFPPPSPPASLTPGAPPTLHDGPLISRDKVRDALLMLVQDDQLIDMFYQTLQKVHHS